MTCILTMHSPNHPLLQALHNNGVKIKYLRNIEHIHTIDLAEIDVWFSRVFTEIKYPLALYNTLSKLREYAIPYVFWNRDAPWNCGMKNWHRWVLNYMNPLDIYFTHSGQESLPCQVSCYLPNAARDAYRFIGDLNELSKEQGYLYDICFMGAFSNNKRIGCIQRRLFIDELQEFLKKRHIHPRIKIIDTSIEKLSLDEQLYLIQHSKINLNYGANCDLPNQPSWGLPERVFGIPASGGFLLTEYRACLPHTFAEGTYDTFLDTEECVEKINFYLNNFDILRARADRLHQEILEKHMYSNRANTFMEHTLKYRR